MAGRIGSSFQDTCCSLERRTKQRLAIARTLAANPDIILYDEPTSGLDAASGARVAELIRNTHEAHHRTSIIVTHDYETLIPIADEVLLLDSEHHQLIAVPETDWSQIPSRMRPVQVSAQDGSSTTGLQLVFGHVDSFLASTGATVVATARLPYDLLPLFPRPAGITILCPLPATGRRRIRLGLSDSGWPDRGIHGNLFYLSVPAISALHSLCLSMNFWHRSACPVSHSCSRACHHPDCCRCGAAIAADVGVKQYGGQIDAMQHWGSNQDCTC